MSYRPLAGHGGPKSSAVASIPRLESDTLPGRSNTGVNGGASNLAFTAANAGAKTSRGAVSTLPGLSLDATIRRVQQSWEATRAAEMRSSPGNAASHDAHAEIQRMKDFDRTSAAASSHLGKRSSSGAFEEVLGRKRRAVENRRNASDRSGLSTPVSRDSSEEASRRRSLPTAGIVNGTSADKPQDGPQVLRAVRSATNKPLSPALRGAEAKTARPQVLIKTPSGRPYKVYQDHEGKMSSSCGALIPDGYELHDDDGYPFICPIRSCRKLYRNMTALGAHFGAGHRFVNLNDNGDGTLSIVGEFKTASGPITARVVSRKRLDSSEPPMPTPNPPHYIRPITTIPSNGSSPPDTARDKTAAMSRRFSRAPSLAVDSPESSSVQSWSPSPVRDSAAPTPDLGTKVMPYLRAVLPPEFDFGLFTVCKEGPLLLQLPVKRHITPKWITRVTSLKLHLPLQRCLVGMLLFLTGTPAENPCHLCVAASPPDECIIATASFPSFDTFEGSCALCFYKSNRWHQKNKCRLQEVDGPTPVETTAEIEPPEARPEEDDMSTETDDEAVENEASAIAGLSAGTSKNRTLPVKRPGKANGTSERRAQSRPPPPQHSASELHISSPTRNSQGASAHGALLNPGNLVPADTLEMEDWEIAPGTIRSTSDEPDNIAFSNAYLFSNMAVPVAPGIAFNVITLKPGGGHKFPAQQSLRLCSLATGKLSVKMEQETGDVGFQMGPNGMFKVYPGTVASVRNRLYVDAVLHVSTVDSSDA